MGQLRAACFRIVQEQAVQDFERQDLVDFRGVIALPGKVPPDCRFHPFSLNIRPGQAARVKQHLPNIIRQVIPVPDPKVKDLMPAEEQAFWVKR